MAAVLNTSFVDPFKSQLESANFDFAGRCVGLVQGACFALQTARASLFQRTKVSALCATVLFAVQHGGANLFCGGPVACLAAMIIKSRCTGGS